MNQFVTTAVAEKLAALETARFFSERQQRADVAQFDAVFLMMLFNREGGAPPRPGDEMPEVGG